jgi:hypothetical protein
VNKEKIQSEMDKIIEQIPDHRFKDKEDDRPLKVEKDEKDNGKKER